MFEPLQKPTRVVQPPHESESQYQFLTGRQKVLLLGRKWFSFLEHNLKFVYQKFSKLINFNTNQDAVINIDCDCYADTLWIFNPNALRNTA